MIAGWGLIANTTQRDHNIIQKRCLNINRIYRAYLFKSDPSNPGICVSPCIISRQESNMLSLLQTVMPTVEWTRAPSMRPETMVMVRSREGWPVPGPGEQWRQLRLAPGYLARLRQTLLTRSQRPGPGPLLPQRRRGCPGANLFQSQLLHFQSHLQLNQSKKVKSCLPSSTRTGLHRRLTGLCLVKLNLLPENLNYSRV